MAKILYTAKASVTGGRAGHGRTADGELDVDLRLPEEMGGPGGGKIPAVGVPSASAVPGAGHAAAAYHLYKIGGEKGAWSCELISRGITPAGEMVEQKRMNLFS